MDVYTGSVLALAVLTPFTAVVRTFSNLGQRLDDHIKQDEARYDEIRDMLKETRSDIKDLLKR